jgi:hypothetical protein
VREDLFQVVSWRALIDPDAAAAALLKVVDADDPPLRVLLGIDPDVMRRIYAERLREWSAWGDVARSVWGRSPR